MGSNAASLPPPDLVNKGVPNAPFYLPETIPSAGTAMSSKLFPHNETLPLLYQPIEIGGMTFKNRIQVAPMCQYSAIEGVPTPWHLVHLGGFATRGASLVIAEASAVLPNGRISPQCPGLWNDEQRDAWKPIFDFVKANGARAGIQLAHAGRKASTVAPWLNMSLTRPHVNTNIANDGEAGGWTSNVWAPSAIPYLDEQFPDPKAMTLEDIEEFKAAWKASVKRADEAGVDVVEIHSAHGYLLHEFLSPISNKRTDKYGGSLENRLRLAMEVIEITRSTLPAEKPVFVRISATDNSPEGEKNEQGEYISWGIEQSKIYLAEASKRGVAFLDASSSGNDHKQKIKLGPGYQVPFAEQLRASLTNENRIPISAVGLITDGTQAEQILQEGKADIISVAREFLRNADLVFDWAQELGVSVSVPVQYERAHTRMFKHAQLVY
ncbi:hypothetical protein BCR35DRAFT_283785 [Leucosporidium creatinivorum]|uniref:NADH:flavin oxidoreductase/NADH oxidase N-terminal domain-containing protein n=1 Tax=Leucosporidium creatinivorum TaxID=106004 RepID=A0A1Y2DGX1_9BASI|nr:hypothetical protein BCR35DRAFT_283785 [Leucosporidium creatinivorum]